MIKSKTVNTVVATARHGDVSIVGDGRRQYGLGFRCGEFGTEEEEKSS
jgi:hypothetical protein